MLLNPLHLDKPPTMSLTKKFLLLAFIALFGFVLYTFYSTGFFRTIENRFDGELVKEIPIQGAEDIIVNEDAGFAIISATARKGFPAVEQEFGGLYLMELTSGAFVLKHLTADLQLPFAPHGISMFKEDSTYVVAAINHTETAHTVEFFSLHNEELTHTGTVKSSKLVSPNDLVLIDENRFYITNDHAYEEGVGRLLEDYGNLAVSNVLFYDGVEFKEVAEGISFANGINRDEERNLVFVASPRRFLVKAFREPTIGTLEFVEDLDCGTGVDNIEFDSDGNLWIGCHPDLLGFTAYSKKQKEIAPSEIVKVTYRGEGDYDVSSIYENDGTQISATSVAAPYQDLIFAGSVVDKKMLILKLTE